MSILNADVGDIINAINILSLILTFLNTDNVTINIIPYLNNVEEFVSFISVYNPIIIITYILEEMVLRVVK